ncbi:MAG: LptF/LptG family permease [Synergistes sp.]|nr:LptF/LptG family permease [Synergistes sp.]
MKGKSIFPFKFRVLDRYILGELRSSFFFGLVAFTTILVAGGLLFQMAELIIEKGVSVGTVIRLFLYYMPRLVVFTIPMSCLLASLLGFGRLSSNSEIVALKSTGLSFQRIVRPVTIAAFFISIIAFIINESVVPVSEKAAANVMRYEVLKQAAPLFTQKVFIKEEDGGVVKRVIYIDKMDSSTNLMKDVTVEEFEQGRLARIITSKNGKWEEDSWWLINGAVYDISQKTKEVALLFKFDRQALRLNLRSEDIESVNRKPDEMGIKELLGLIRLKEKLGENPGDLWMAFHLRIAVPWACLIFALLGAALGSRPQRASSGVGFGFSVIIIFVYYVIMSFSKALGESGSLPPILAAWVANFVFLVISLLLCARANRLG